MEERQGVSRWRGEWSRLKRLQGSRSSSSSSMLALPRQSTNNHPDCPTAPNYSLSERCEALLTVSPLETKSGGGACLLPAIPITLLLPIPAQNVVDQVLQILIRWRIVEQQLIVTWRTDAIISKTPNNVFLEVTVFVAMSGQKLMRTSRKVNLTLIINSPLTGNPALLA